MAYLPTHLTRHELLTAAERAYLDGLDLPSAKSVAAFTTLATAVLASRVDGYHQEPNAPHWKPAALLIYTSSNHVGRDGLSEPVYAAEAGFLRATHDPREALSLLIQVEANKRAWRLQQAEPKIMYASQLGTSDRHAQQQQIAASLDCQQQTGHSYHDILKA